MNILVLTLADDNFAQVREVSEPNKRAYAEKHGYPFIHETELLDPSRNASWNKIPYVLKYLPDFDWVFWTDADSLVMNPDVRLEDVIGDTDKDFLAMAKNNNPNCGEFLIRNCPWSEDFFRRVYAEPFVKYDAWEETAVTRLINRNADDRSHVQWIPHQLLNSFVDPHHPNNYKEGDFIAHFAGMSQAECQGGRDGAIRKLVEMMRSWAYGEPYERE